MSTGDDDVRSGERSGPVPAPLLDTFPESRQAAGANPAPPDSCASCGASESVQWLTMVTDWSDALCDDLGVARPDGDCLVPLCTRCRAWAEIIEVAELAAPDLPEAQRDRIHRERNRFLATVDPGLVRGIRLSAELSSFSG